MPPPPNSWQLPDQAKMIFDGRFLARKIGNDVCCHLVCFGVFVASRRLYHFQRGPISSDGGGKKVWRLI